MRIVELYGRHLVDLDLLPPNPTVVDMGMGWGEFGLSAQKLKEFKGCLMYGFEPSVANGQVLAKIGSALPHKEYYRRAIVGKRNSRLRFTEYWGTDGKYHQWGDMLGEHRSFLAGKKGVTIKRYPVKQVQIGDLLKFLKLKRIDYLKVDIEGAEKGVFRNWPPGLSRRVQQVSVEVHSGPARKEVARVLRNAYPSFTEKGTELFGCRGK